jgi:hypothetical protein
MKLYVDTTGKQVTVTKDPTEKTEAATEQQPLPLGLEDVLPAGSFLAWS